MAKKTYYSLKRILEYNATYNIIIGRRSNGKTYAALYEILANYIKTEGKEQGAIIRRWEEDFRGRRGQAFYRAIVDNGEVTKLTEGVWNGVTYYSGAWYLSNYDSDLDKTIRAGEPFCYGFSLTQKEHDKSTSYPRVTKIVFDEFITDGMYLPNEFVTFMNVLSTIIRDRSNVTIFMLGNTINKYCPYFAEMNLNKVATQKQGTIDIYKYVKHPDLKVAVEYCLDKNQESKKLKEEDKYFGFDNPKLQMITTGAWEIANYPRLPEEYTRDDVMLMYFIEFDGNILACNVIMGKNSGMFTFIHRWTRDISKDTEHLIFSTEYSSRPNMVRRITAPQTNLQRKLLNFYKQDKVFYSENEVGDVVKNYLLWCRT